MLLSLHYTKEKLFFLMGLYDLEVCTLICRKEELGVEINLLLFTDKRFLSQHPNQWCVFTTQGFLRGTKPTGPPYNSHSKHWSISQVSQDLSFTHRSCLHYASYNNRPELLHSDAWGACSFTNTFTALNLPGKLLLLLLCWCWERSLPAVLTQSF